LALSNRPVSFTINIHIFCLRQNHFSTHQIHARSPDGSRQEAGRRTPSWTFLDPSTPFSRRTPRSSVRAFLPLIEGRPCTSCGFCQEFVEKSMSDMEGGSGGFGGFGGSANPISTEGNDQAAQAVAEAASRGGNYNVAPPPVQYVALMRNNNEPARMQKLVAAMHTTFTMDARPDNQAMWQQIKNKLGPHANNDETKITELWVEGRMSVILQLCTRIHPSYSKRGRSSRTSTPGSSKLAPSRRLSAGLRPLSPSSIRASSSRAPLRLPRRCYFQALTRTSRALESLMVSARTPTMSCRD
jgi:hypothetical protein